MFFMPALNKWFISNLATGSDIAQVVYSVSHMYIDCIPAKHMAWTLIVIIAIPNPVVLLHNYVDFLYQLTLLMSGSTLSQCMSLDLYSQGIKCTYIINVYSIVSVCINKCLSGHLVVTSKWMKMSLDFNERVICYSNFYRQIHFLYLTLP